MEIVEFGVNMMHFIRLFGQLVFSNKDLIYIFLPGYFGWPDYFALQLALLLEKH